MVMRRLVIVLWCLLSNAAIARPLLELKIDKTETELGQPIDAELHARALQRNLREIDLLPLTEAFGVSIIEFIDDSNETTSDNDRLQILKLRLIPRRTGELDIPSLELQGIRSRPLRVAVAPGTVDGQAIELDVHVSAHTVWQREQILVQVTIKTPDQFASLHSESIDLPGFEVIPIAATRESIQDDAQHKAALHIGWVLIPHGSGPQVIDLPPVSYSLSGLVQRVYYLPRPEVHVRALPPYIPPTTPVGKADVTSAIEFAPPLRTDTLAFWNITLRSASLTPRWFPPVLRNVKSNEAIQFFPVETERETSPDFDGVHGRVTHRVPLKALRSGRLALPVLEFQYFDPESGKLVSVTHQPERPLAVSGIWLAVSALLLLYASYRALRFGVALWQRVRVRRIRFASALEAIAQAPDWRALRAALKLHAQAMDWPQNISLSDWAACWKARYRSDDELDELLNSLEMSCYSPRHAEAFDDTRAALLRYVRYPQRRRRRDRHCCNAGTTFADNA